MVGGTWYTYIKYREGQEKHAKHIPEEMKALHEAVSNKQGSVTSKSNGFIKVDIPDENENSLSGH